MKTLNFTCRRAMHGDKVYADGDERQLTAVDAAPLVRSGALEPADKEAKEAMEKLFKSSGGDVVQPVPDRSMDEHNAKAAKEGASPTPAKSAQPVKTKDAGNAERNKADVNTPSTGTTVNAGDAGAELVDPDAAKDEQEEAPAKTAEPAKAKKKAAPKKAAPKKKKR